MFKIIIFIFKSIPLNIKFEGPELTSDGLGENDEEEVGLLNIKCVIAVKIS